MSGLAPITVYVSAVLLAVLGLAWLTLRIAKRGEAKLVGVGWAATAAICFGFFALEKFVGLGYTKGFYLAMVITLVVGVAAGLAIRRAR